MACLQLQQQLGHREVTHHYRAPLISMHRPQTSALAVKMVQWRWCCAFERPRAATDSPAPLILSQIPESQGCTRALRMLEHEWAHDAKEGDGVRTCPLIRRHRALHEDSRVRGDAGVQLPQHDQQAG